MIKEKKIALAGNPNVGKSTVFNALTGLSQHTGNWSGKTVDVAAGKTEFDGQSIQLIDLPGTYSLMASGDEEEIAGNYLLFGEYDSVIIICDATVLERNLILVLQILEITRNAVICVNMIDEADKKGIVIDKTKLEEQLGVPVVFCSARSKIGLDELLEKAVKICDEKKSPLKIDYNDSIDKTACQIEDCFDNSFTLNKRFCALKLLDDDKRFHQKLYNFIPENTLTEIEIIQNSVQDRSTIKDMLTTTVVNMANSISETCIKSKGSNERDRKIDRILTGKYTAIPIMLCLLALVLFITLYAANIPSGLLSDFFTFVQGKLNLLLVNIGTPTALTSLVCDGIFKTLSWVVAVMLPPMAIFFPLFTILEDIGYLPRIAFNLDKQFKKSCACGKQALTMCMGFGCNAVGVTGCRIIESKRERSIAQLTNVFVPCNGRFPTLIAVITMFIATASSSFLSYSVSAIVLTAIIVLGILMTFAISKLLSKTLFKGEPSSFVLELPPYRVPQFGKVIVTSLLNRTLFVLLRAVVVAAPAGAIIWLLANLSVGGESILMQVSSFLDPFAKLLGLDGVILFAFILGFPANEIVIPIIIMSYTASNSLMDMSSLSTLKNLLVDNGWTIFTAINVMLFSLMHWPCSTTCITIYKETKSISKTLLAIAIPTICGMLACALVNLISLLF